MSARLKILFLNEDVVPEERLAIFRERIPEGFDFDIAMGSDEAAKLEKLKDADAGLLWRGHFTAAMMDAAPRLRMIQRLGQGLDKVDVEAARARGIVVANAGGSNAVSVAEHAVMLMLAAYKRLKIAVDALRAGGWLRWEFRKQLHELRGKTVGILGMGNIGREVAKRVKAFDTTVLYYDVIRLPEEKEQELGVRYLPFHDLLKEADLITIHCPLLPETRHMINASTIELMKPSVVLVNTSRGGVIDEEALIAALRSGRIAAAGLDVFSKEPLPADNPLPQMPNVVCTSHVAGSSQETDYRRAEYCLGNIARVLQGETGK